MRSDQSCGTASRAGLGNVVPFPRPQNPHGSISIHPCALNGGGWAVEHLSRSGDSVAYLGSFLSLEDAVVNALRWAESLGADFDDGARHDPS
jgi:hypothetical protein